MPIRRSRRSARCRPSRCARKACRDVAGCSPAPTARQAGRWGLSRAGSGSPSRRYRSPRRSAGRPRCRWRPGCPGVGRGVGFGVGFGAVERGVAGGVSAGVRVHDAVVGQVGWGVLHVGITWPDRVGASVRGRAAAAATSGEAEPEKQCNHRREGVDRYARQDRNYRTSRVIDASNVSRTARDRAPRCTCGRVGCQARQGWPPCAPATVRRAAYPQESQACPRLVRSHNRSIRPRRQRPVCWKARSTK